MKNQNVIDLLLYRICKIIFFPSFIDEPVITHGLTLTSKIRFRDVVQVIRVSNDV